MASPTVGARVRYVDSNGETLVATVKRVTSPSLVDLEVVSNGAPEFSGPGVQILTAVTEDDRTFRPRSWHVPPPEEARSEPRERILGDNNDPGETPRGPNDLPPGPNDVPPNSK